MPVYDCGDPDCTECQRAFGPDRTKAIAHFHERERRMDRLAALLEARAHLGAALVQTVPSDDQIIMDHVRAAKQLLDGATL